MKFSKIFMWLWTLRVWIMFRLMGMETTWKECRMFTKNSKEIMELSVKMLMTEEVEEDL